MKRFSRTLLAKAAVAALGTHTLSEVVMALAFSLRKQRLDADVSVVTRTVADQLFKIKGHVLAQVYFARPLSKKMKTAIEDFLLQTPGAKTVTISYEVDELLVGSVKIVTSEGVYDFSVAQMLDQLIETAV